MNLEKKNQIEQIVKLFIIIVCASLYAWGGMEGKYLRRFVAPSIAGVSAFAITKNWLTLLKTPLLIGASCLGYGADAVWLKVIKRLYCGIAFALGASINELIEAIRGSYKSWIIFSLVISVIPFLFVICGVLNPFSDSYAGARIEETFLGLIIYTFTIMPLRRKK